MDVSLKYDSSKGVVKVATFTDVRVNSQSQMRAALALGPVSVAIEAYQIAF